MELQFTLDTLEGVDESIQSLYQEQDGKFQLKVAGLPPKEDTTALKNALERQKASVSALKEKNASLSQFEAYADYEGIGDILPNLDEIIAKANAAGDPEGLERAQAKYKAELAKQQSEFNTLAEENNKLKTSIKNSSINNDVRAAALAAGAIPEKVDDLLSLTRASFDNADNETFVRDAEGHPLGVSPKDWFGTVQMEQRPDYFKASGASGSGTRNTGGTVSQLTIQNAKTPEDMTKLLKSRNFVEKQVINSPTK